VRAQIKANNRLHPFLNSFRCVFLLSASSTRPAPRSAVLSPRISRRVLRRWHTFVRASHPPKLNPFSHRKTNLRYPAASESIHRIPDVAVPSHPASHEPSGHSLPAGSSQPSHQHSSHFAPPSDASNNLKLLEQQQQHTTHSQPQFHSSASVPSPAVTAPRSTLTESLSPAQPQPQFSSESRYACFNCMPDIAPLSIPSVSSSHESSSPSLLDKIRQRLSAGDPPPLAPPLAVSSDSDTLPKARI
jgi:hypothetical protein